jgi:hypothetical protein
MTARLPLDALGASSVSLPSRTAENAALGINGKSGDQKAFRNWRRSAYGDTRKAAKLLMGKDEKLSLSLHNCNWSGFEDYVGLHRSLETGRASFSGLQTCKKVWLCPCCSARISWLRKLELDTLLAWARSQGYFVKLLTLTASHKRGDALAPLLASLKGAKKRLRERREWRALPLVGSVTATEVTHGANSFHPHFHEILIFRENVDLSPLLPVWLKCLSGFGLSGNERALHSQNADAAGDYIAKFGAAEELTLTGSKDGRGKSSRSPWQLLADSGVDDPQASAAWIEYALAIKGARQLVWSRGLKALSGVDDVTDDDISDPVSEKELLAVWQSRGLWKEARPYRASLLEAAETGRCLDTVQRGSTDLEVQEALSPSGSVFE